MKRQFKIGKSLSNEIVIRDKSCPNLLAEINYEKGNWILKPLVNEKQIFVNNKKVESQILLNKNDKIRIGKQTIHWSNYLYEGDNQELYFSDIISYNGRISRSNFRALSLLSIGMIICVFFLPGLLVSIWRYINRRRFRNAEFDYINAIQEISPTVYTIGFSIIVIIVLLLAVKRIRDTGNPIWKLLIPIYNLKILYFDESKK